MEQRNESTGILSRIAYALCGVFVALSYSLVSFLFALIPGISDLDSTTRRLIFSGIWLVLAAVAAIVLRLTKGEDPSVSFRILENKSKKQAWIIPVCSAAAFVGGVALNRLITVGFSLIPFPDAWTKAYDEAISGTVQGNPFVAVLAVCVAAPLIEELAFRGKAFYYFKKAAGGRAGTVVAALATSLLFALFHGNFIQALYAFVCGLIFALLTIRCGSVIPSVFAHIGFNAANLIFYAFLNNPNRANMELLVNIACAVVFAACTAGIIVIGDFLAEKKEKKDETPQDIYIN